MDTMANDYRTTVVNGLEMRSASALLSTDTNMQLQGETVNAIGTKRLLMHSDEQVLANSRGRMDMKSDGSLNMEQKADDVKKEEKERMALATVEFRPDAAYNGEFGFDWLRVKGDPVPKQVQDKDSGGSSQPRSGKNGKSDKSGEPARPVETSYKEIILGGFCDGKRNLTKDEAYERLKKEYVKEMSDLEGVPKPCYKATLRMLVDINEEVDRLEFDYDKDIFEIDRATLTDKEKTQGKTESKDKTIEITCKKSFGDENRGVIRVFAYPKGCADKPMAEQVRLRSLAGKIMVGVNDEKAQKEMKFVLVRVKTKIGVDAKTGSFSSDHLRQLSNTLHQMYINPSFEQYLKDKEGNVLMDNNGNPKIIVLDLIRDKRFMSGGMYVKGGNIQKFTKQRVGMTLQRYLDSNVARYLRLVLLRKFPQYHGFFTIFSFDEKGFDEEDELYGFCESVCKRGTTKFSHYKKNVVFFANPKAMVLSHEVLHGMGLHHTHLDEKVVEEDLRRYVYKKNTTNNVMSYASVRKSTWNWQWEIIRKKLK